MEVFGADVNLIWLVLMLMTVATLLVGFFVNYAEAFVPGLLNDAFRYGKTARRGNRQLSTSPRLLSLFEVPKHWFSHFYVFATFYNTAWWAVCFAVYTIRVQVDEALISALDWVATADRRATANCEGVFLALTLLTLQSYRRLYECGSIHVKSEAKMNAAHYAVGFVHYACAAAAVVSEAPGFTSDFTVHDDHLRGVRWLHLTLNWRNLVTPGRTAALIVFLWASLKQHQSFKILAALRQRRDGKETSSYSVPKGGLFDWVSCPHYTCEVAIYACLSAILGWNHRSGMVLLLWVCANQTVSALLSHFWYQENFPRYPSSRKAIIPFIL